MLTTADLNQIKGLCEYLNKAFGPPHDIAADVTLTDSNGSTVGRVYYSSDVVGEHVFEMV